VSVALCSGLLRPRVLLTVRGSNSVQRIKAIDLKAPLKYNRVQFYHVILLKRKVRGISANRSHIALRQQT
jgi:hypothetical protein